MRNKKELPGSSKDQRKVNERSVLAKLVRNRGFARGDFEIVQGEAAGTRITNMSITSASTSDKGKTPKVGEFFYIFNFPANQNVAQDPDKLNSPIHRERMTASPILTEKDNISSVSGIPPSPLATMLKNMVGAVLSRAKSAPTTCQVAPVTLEDAVKRLKKTGGGGQGDKYKMLPPNGEIVNDPETGEKTFLGMHMEYDKDGNMSIGSNDRGLVIDKDGKILTQGGLELKESPSQPHGLIGMDTKRNALIEFQPNTFIMPAGLGPLALDRIPDFSLINWGLKVMDTIEVTKDLAALIAEKKKSGQSISEIVAEKQKERDTSVAGKIV